jgi:protein-disulfide isomerase
MAEGPLGERALGNPNAPITVIEYASLTCPHCASFQRDVFPRVKKEFIDTGKIRFIVREFPIGRTSGAAAIATRCVPPEKYFSLFSAFLLRQPEWVSQEVRPDAIYSVAKSSGLSRAEFDKCATNQTIIDGLTEVKQRGRKFGVVGTPTFFANGRKAQGTITFEEFKALLDPQSAT